MSDTTKASLRIVTPEQFQQGYFALENGIITNKKYVPLKKFADGNWVVQEPLRKEARQ